MAHSQTDCREADKHVDKLFKPCPRAKNHMDDIPVSSSHEATYSHKTPVDAADNHEDKLYSM